VKTASGVAGEAAAVTATTPLRTRGKSHSSEKQRNCGEAPHEIILLPEGPIPDDSGRGRKQRPELMLDDFNTRSLINTRSLN
jgi:hypothetical protein